MRSTGPAVALPGCASAWTQAVLGQATPPGTSAQALSIGRNLAAWHETCLIMHERRHCPDSFEQERRMLAALRTLALYVRKHRKRSQKYIPSRSPTQQLPGQQRTDAGKQRSLLGRRQAFGTRQVRAADEHLRTNRRRHQEAVQEAGLFCPCAPPLAQASASLILVKLLQSSRGPQPPPGPPSYAPASFWALRTCKPREGGTDSSASASTSCTQPWFLQLAIGLPRPPRDQATYDAPCTSVCPLTLASTGAVPRRLQHVKSRFKNVQDRLRTGGGSGRLRCLWCCLCNSRIG